MIYPPTTEGRRSMSKAQVEQALGRTVTAIHDADALDEAMESPELLAREAARGILAEYDEEPDEVMEASDGFVVTSGAHAIFMGHDGSFDLVDLPDEDTDDDPDEGLDDEEDVDLDDDTDEEEEDVDLEEGDLDEVDSQFLKGVMSEVVDRASATRIEKAAVAVLSKFKGATTANVHAYLAGSSGNRLVQLVASQIERSGMHKGKSPAETRAAVKHSKAWLSALQTILHRPTYRKQFEKFAGQHESFSEDGVTLDSLQASVETILSDADPRDEGLIDLLRVFDEAKVEGDYEAAIEAGKAIGAPRRGARPGQERRIGRVRSEARSSDTGGSETSEARRYRARTRQEHG
jgi:hypothetical protein